MSKSRPRKLYSPPVAIRSRKPNATFESRWDDLVALVGDEVARVWRLYLVGGGMAFRDGRMGVDQILSVRPDDRGVSSMPLVRTHG